MVCMLCYWCWCWYAISEGVHHLCVCMYTQKLHRRRIQLLAWQNFLTATSDRFLGVGRSDGGWTTSSSTATTGCAQCGFVASRTWIWRKTALNFVFISVSHPASNICFGFQLLATFGPCSCSAPLVAYDSGTKDEAMEDENKKKISSGNQLLVRRKLLRCVDGDNFHKGLETMRCRLLECGKDPKCNVQSIYFHINLVNV